MSNNNLLVILDDDLLYNNDNNSNGKRNKEEEEEFDEESDGGGGGGGGGGDEESDGDGGGGGGGGGGDEESDGGVDIVVKTKKQRILLSPELKYKGTLIHQSWLLIGLWKLLRRSSIIDNDDEIRARAFSILQHKSICSTLKSISYDLDLCVAYLRHVACVPCRLISAFPFVSWRPLEKEEERSASLKGFSFWLEYFDNNTWYRFCPDDASNAHFHGQDLSYVVGVCLGEVVDVSQRYANEWSKCYKRRNSGIEKWWASTLQIFNTATSVDRPWSRVDEEERVEQLLSEPIPTALSRIKSHPSYILKDHVPRYMALDPEAEPVGHFGAGEIEVYLRDAMVPIHSADKWVEKGKVIRPGEEPIKRFPSRSKKGQDTCLYGPWQTEDVDVGEAVDGIVPKNPHGNVYLYAESMMPRGCTLLDEPGLSLVLTKQLGIDAAKAVVGFTFKRGRSYPQYAEGLVVATENVDILRMACAEQLEVSKEKEDSRNAKRITSNWRRLIRRALVYHRLKKGKVGE